MKTTFAGVILVLMIFFAVSASSQRLILRGDHPDLSIVKMGDTYWASATTSNWMPVYPILKSPDMVHSTTEGYVFESFRNGQITIFGCRNKRTTMATCTCIMRHIKKAATFAWGLAAPPEGPYKDHEPIDV